MKKKANDIEKLVINYLIKNAIEGKAWNELDKTFLNCKGITGALQHWATVYSSIYKQLELNPKDKNGYSITPTWIREVYTEFRKNKANECWKPNELGLASMVETTKTKPTVPEKKVKPKNEDIIAWTVRGDNRTLNILDIEGSSEFKKGYLKAKNAFKVFRIKKEEIGLDAL